MHFNVITPMMRFKNIPLLKHMLSMHDVTWHVVVDDDLGFGLQFDEDWIMPYRCPNDAREFWARSNTSLNWFIANHVDGDEYWCFLNDDDAYDPEFFVDLEARIQLAKSHGKPADVVITAMERGYRLPEGHAPESAHPPTRLNATPESARRDHVSIEQIFLTGNVLKQFRIPLHPSGDGIFIDEVIAYRTKENVLYCDDIAVLFNYYEPGRW